MKRDFNKWLSKFREVIADWKYYTDFPKVYRNVDKIKIELNLLNSLVGSKNIEKDFRLLINRYPEVLKVVPILIAKRDYEITINDKGKDKIFNFNNANYTIDEYVKFMDKSGLFDLISNRIIANLIDYVKGVEVGLDTNARKNRTGSAMANIVEQFIIDAGFIKDVNYFKEMSKKRINEEFGINLDLESIDGKKANKIFDFVVKTNATVYGIEVNFYTGGGSKLNETARSYKLLSLEANEIEGFEFIWITDGKGWHTAKGNLEETFEVMDYLFNLNDLEQGILKNILK